MILVALSCDGGAILEGNGSSLYSRCEMQPIISEGRRTKSKCRKSHSIIFIEKLLYIQKVQFWKALKGFNVILMLH